MTTDARKTFTIEGGAIHDIRSFYGEINRIFMADEDWKLGESLDGLNDLFYGGFGAISGDEPVTLVWREIEKSATDLGLEAARGWHRQKLEHPKTFDATQIQRSLDALETGEGKTYFEIVLDIIADHPNIDLVKA
ncbi:ribonuclease inhibitor [Sphingobium sp. LB126]|uniref:ribonuclease inhibitor n=1 Tax=Sphingobium sp. LB126 TaxID=1983755 RepID=UPI000C1FEEC1|nr:ribonuclease inhibitor [Sphingobium sp. LB126]PJG47085.1 ribonuclease inhibitor [Sphingobium sp. LB126]